MSILLCIPGIYYKCIVCLCITNNENNNWQLVITTIIIVMFNHLCLVPVMCQVLFLSVFFWHFAKGDIDLKVTNRGHTGSKRQSWNLNLGAM